MKKIDLELTLVTNSGEELLRAGDCAAFQRGVDDGHHSDQQISPLGGTFRPAAAARNVRFREDRQCSSA
jgi:hypothetical protein